jgi:hypothetical protein
MGSHLGNLKHLKLWPPPKRDLKGFTMGDLFMICELRW